MLVFKNLPDDQCTILKVCHCVYGSAYIVNKGVNDNAILNFCIFVCRFYNGDSNYEASLDVLNCTVISRGEYYELYV